MPKQRTGRLDDPELRKARALMILQMRLTGHSMAAVMERFKMSENTVRREIDYAKRHNLVADFEEQVLSELVPSAMTALRAALDGGSETAALEVLKGMGILKKPSSKPLTEPPPEVQEESLALHIKRISKRGGALGQGTASGERQLPAGAASDIIEGSLLEGPADSTATASPAVGAARDESRATDAAQHVDLSDDAAGPQAESAPAA